MLVCDNSSAIDKLEKFVNTEPDSHEPEVRNKACSLLMAMKVLNNICQNKHWQEGIN